MNGRMKSVIVDCPSIVINQTNAQPINYQKGRRVPYCNKSIKWSRINNKTKNNEQKTNKENHMQAPQTRKLTIFVSFFLSSPPLTSPQSLAERRNLLLLFVVVILLVSIESENTKQFNVRHAKYANAKKQEKNNTIQNKQKAPKRLLGFGFLFLFYFILPFFFFWFAGQLKKNKTKQPKKPSQIQAKLKNTVLSSRLKKVFVCFFLEISQESKFRLIILHESFQKKFQKTWNESLFLQFLVIITHGK
ncbi:hypothetical protein RFI_13248 [Reticulomyxa filosa]|uniref:Transmembrane protein n=1 Tax=Reticulomyxa filosa TaxID=46433 RepID=X6NDG0_RETFI|nr:hypothetical protein RFI_13248 [Reticulomyxa filosa]|eukprot:ETO23913.1 hypothetical protein RFI_13248 [Reticulomyxa filosa]